MNLLAAGWAERWGQSAQLELFPVQLASKSCWEEINFPPLSYSTRPSHSGSGPCEVQQCSDLGTKGNICSLWLILTDLEITGKGESMATDLLSDDHPSGQWGGSFPAWAIASNTVLALIRRGKPRPHDLLASVLCISGRLHSETTAKSCL